jgi:primase-polymerase (primpol)-like protein
VVNFDGIPEELKGYGQWVLWKWAKAKPNKDGIRKWTKVPWSCNSRKADPTKPSTWFGFSQVRILYEAEDSSYDGIGFVFAADDPFTGTDLDDAIDLATGELKPWAAKIVTDFGTFTDVSPTRTGVKLIGIGDKPGERCKTAYHDGEVEQYSRDRFFTVTGHRLLGTPETIRECQGEISALYAEVFGGPEVGPNRSDSSFAVSVMSVD